MVGGGGGGRGGGGGGVYENLAMVNKFFECFDELHNKHYKRSSE